MFDHSPSVDWFLLIYDVVYQQVMLMDLPKLVVLASKQNQKQLFLSHKFYLKKKKRHRSYLSHVTSNHKGKKTLTRTGVGPLEIGVRICSFLSKIGLVLCDVTVVGVIGDK